jgi:hypothetical protein
MYIPGILPDGSQAVGHIKRGARVVDKLRANLLIGMDILGPEDMVIDLERHVLRVNACAGLEAPIDIQPKAKRIPRHIIRAKSTTMIPPHTSMKIPILKKELPNRDFLFEPYNHPQLGLEGGVLAHIVDAKTAYVEAWNTSDRPVRMAARTRLGYVQEFEAQGCYAAHTDMKALSAGPISFKRHAKALALGAFQDKGNTLIMPVAKRGRGRPRKT